MIYLIDSQLPTGLVDHLKTRGLSAIHVSQCGLERASDREIWAYAKSHNCIIVSKDEDFVHLSGSDSDGPTLVWIRIGNCRNPVLFAAIDAILPALIEEISSGTKVVEVR